MKLGISVWLSAVSKWPSNAAVLLATRAHIVREKRTERQTGTDERDLLTTRADAGHAIQRPFVGE